MVPFGDNVGNTFGLLATMLVAKGTPIGGFDTLIAAHARSLELVLVTNNTKHFSQVAGLRLENWT